MAHLKENKSYDDGFGTINLKINKDLKMKYSALLTLEGKSMQERTIELIKKDVEAKIARQQKAE